MSRAWGGGLYEPDRALTRQAFAAMLYRGMGSPEVSGPELDQYIAQYAKNWKFARIPLPAAAIMRVAMYEILYRPDIPAAASINDAVEIAKKYEDEKIVSFINGILGAFVRAEFPDTPAKPAPEEA